MAPSVLFLRFKPQEFKAFFKRREKQTVQSAKLQTNLITMEDRLRLGKWPLTKKKKKTVILVQKLIGALPSLTVSRRGTNSSLDFQS
jgi:hypothetical protein